MPNVWPRPEPRGEGQYLGLARGQNVEVEDILRCRGRGQYFSLN